MTKILLITTGEFFNFSLDKFCGSTNEAYTNIYEESYPYKNLKLSVETFLEQFIAFYFMNGGKQRDLTKEMYEIIYD